MTVVRTINLMPVNIATGLFIGACVACALIIAAIFIDDLWLDDNKKWFVPLVMIACLIVICKLYVSERPVKQMEIVCNDDVTVNELITTYDVVDVDGLVITVKEKKK